MLTAAQPWNVRGSAPHTFGGGLRGTLYRYLTPAGAWTNDILDCAAFAEAEEALILVESLKPSVAKGVEFVVRYDPEHFLPVEEIPLDIS